MPGPTARICLAMPMPPRVRPAPPESWIMAYSSISSGYSFSSASTGRLDVLVMCTCTASMPSASKRAPAPPPSVSRYTKWPARSRQRPENTMAGQQSLLDAMVFSAGSRPRNAPKIAPATFCAVIERAPTAAGCSGLVMVPTGADTLIGSNRPALGARSGSSSALTA